MADVVRTIERLQEQRGRKEPRLSIGPMVAAVEREAGRTVKKLGELIDTWEALVPGDLAGATRVAGWRGGVMTIVTDSASRKYELDRLLREGLEAELRRSFSGTLVRVKVSLGVVE